MQFTRMVTLIHISTFANIVNDAVLDRVLQRAHPQQNRTVGAPRLPEEDTGHTREGPENRPPSYEGGA